ncbi:MAG: ROK family protein [Oscillospiraceae bacterium]|nr:ROK family protein [Oscillospiraceae bacterium]
MTIGVDLGGTNIAVGLVDEAGNILRRAKAKTLPERGPKAVTDDIAALCRAVMADGGPVEVRSVGIGTPGSIDRERGMVVHAYNLGFDHLPLGPMLEAALPGIPVRVENDANAAALGEAFRGGARDYASSILVTLGTGIGGGIVMDGKLLTGHNGAAGEIGHHVIVFDGHPCTCGMRGCWEAYASATGLIRQTAEAMDAAPDSAMHAISAAAGKVSGRTAFEAARAGDAAGRAVVERYLDYLAAGLINLINILQPEAVCIGGGVAGEGRPFLEAVRGRVKRGVFRSEQGETEVVLAELGNDAGLIGAALVGRAGPY